MAGRHAAGGALTPAPAAPRAQRATFRNTVTVPRAVSAAARSGRPGSPTEEHRDRAGRRREREIELAIAVEVRDPGGPTGSIAPGGADGGGQPRSRSVRRGAAAPGPA